VTGQRNPPACSHWLSGTRRHCGNPDTRLYLVGHRCAEHTPARLAGHPEPVTEALGAIQRNTATSTANAT